MKTISWIAWVVVDRDTGAIIDRELYDTEGEASRAAFGVDSILKTDTMAVAVIPLTSI